MSSDELVVHVGSRRVRVQIEVEEDPAVSNHVSAASAEAAPSGEDLGSTELVPATGPAPLHLLVRSNLGSITGTPPITPQERIRRAYRFGQQDSQAALDAAIQAPSDQFPFANRWYAILYQPNGDWPKVVGNLRDFYKLVKEQRGDRSPDRSSPWKPGIYSRGFPSKVEVEAYLWGASCRFPREQSQN